MFEFIKRFFRRKDKMEKDNISLSEVESIIMWHFSSDSYRMMLDGNRYYAGEHDILKRNRTAIGDDGKLITVNNLIVWQIVNCYQFPVIAYCRSVPFQYVVFPCIIPVPVKHHSVTVA